MATLTKLIAQILFDFVKDTSDIAWKFIILVRKCLKYVQMLDISRFQVMSLDRTINELMNVRMEMTRTERVSKSGSCYTPNIKWKEHFIR